MLRPQCWSPSFVYKRIVSPFLPHHNAISAVTSEVPVKNIHAQHRSSPTALPDIRKTGTTADTLHVRSFSIWALFHATCPVSVEVKNWWSINQPSAEMIDDALQAALVPCRLINDAPKGHVRHKPIPATFKSPSASGLPQQSITTSFKVLDLNDVSRTCPCEVLPHASRCIGSGYRKNQKSSSALHRESCSPARFKPRPSKPFRLSKPMLWNRRAIARVPSSHANKIHRDARKALTDAALTRVMTQAQRQPTLRSSTSISHDHLSPQTPSALIRIEIVRLKRTPFCPACLPWKRHNQ